MAIRDRSIEPLLAYWIAQQKLAERDRDAALADGKTWFKRAKLALSAGRMDLASEAKAEALRARERHDRAVLRLEVIAAERDVLRATRDVGGAIAEAAAEARRRREHAMAEFQLLGIDPGFPLEVPELAEVTDEDAVLDRLRDRMARDRAAAAGGVSSAAVPVPVEAPPVDAATEASAAEAGAPGGPPPRRAAFESIGGDEDAGPAEPGAGGGPDRV